MDEFDCYASANHFVTETFRSVTHWVQRKRRSDYESWSQALPACRYQVRRDLSQGVVVGCRGLSQSGFHAAQIRVGIIPMLKRSERNHNANLTGKLNDNSVRAETLGYFDQNPN